MGTASEIRCAAGRRDYIAAPRMTAISAAWYPGLKWIGAHPAYCGSSGGMVSMQGSVLRPGSIPDPPITHVFVAVVHGCN